MLPAIFLQGHVDGHQHLPSRVSDILGWGRCVIVGYVRLLFPSDPIVRRFFSARASTLCEGPRSCIGHGSRNVLLPAECCAIKGDLDGRS